jgi:hypothetical protein
VEAKKGRKLAAYRVFIVITYLIDVNSVDGGNQRLSVSFRMMHGCSLFGLGFAGKQHYVVGAKSVVCGAQVAHAFTLQCSSFQAVDRVY